MNPEQQEQDRLQQRLDEATAEIEKALQNIFKKSIDYLTDEDKRFLQARVSYLDDAQKSKYEKILKAKVPRPDGKEEEKEIEELTRKELENIAGEIGIDQEKIKKAKRNQDLVDIIEEKKEEIKKAEEEKNK